MLTGPRLRPSEVGGGRQAGVTQSAQPPLRHEEMRATDPGAQNTPRKRNTCGNENHLGRVTKGPAPGLSTWRFTSAQSNGCHLQWHIRAPCRLRDLRRPHEEAAVRQCANPTPLRPASKGFPRTAVLGTSGCGKGDMGIRMHPAFPPRTALGTRESKPKDSAPGEGRPGQGAAEPASPRTLSHSQASVTTHQGRG